MGGMPRYRFLTEDQINAATRSSRLEAEAHRAAREAARDQLHSVLSARLAQLVDQEGGPRKFSRKAGIPHSTIIGWRRGLMPTASALLRVSRSTDVSLDWLFGHDVPRERSEREKIGALRSALHEYLVQSIATALGASADFVRVLLPRPGALVTELRERWTIAVRKILVRKLLWEADRGTPNVERELIKRYSRRAWEKEIQKLEDGEMSKLPPSGFQGGPEDVHELQLRVVQDT